MSAPARDCSCPESDGKIYHQRSTCTDPVARRLDWFSDAPPAREGCPAWCAQLAQHVTDYGEPHHRSDIRQFITPDFWTVWVYLYQIGDRQPVMRVGNLGLQHDDAYPYDQRHDMANLLRMLGHSDIAAAVEELAALATGPEVTR